MTNLLDSGALSTGELLDDRYLLRERIGEGGMARVYRADDLHLRRTVAVKMFRNTADGLSSVERALSETTLHASISHHALVTVFDGRVDPDDVSYLVMEYVDGITLRELIARGPVDAATVAAIGSDLAEGLHAAHSAGIVHRDIKPSNVLLERSRLPGREWRAKLADFGIAYLSDTTRVTSPGLLVGTAAYVAPEQARGAVPAPPADIYSFGLMLIEALTGRRPFAEAEGIGTVMARLTAPPPLPDGLPETWRGLLCGMTALQPGDRPTALEVAVAFSHILAPERAAAASAIGLPTAPIAVQTGPTVALPLSATPDDAMTDAAASTSPLETEGAAAAVSVGAAGVGGGAGLAGRVGAERPRDSRRRRGLVVGTVVAALALVAALVGALWLSNLPAGDADPTPSPTPVIEEQQQTPSPTEEPPPAQTPVDDQGGNDNSGPGNNNGNGGGNGNGNGNGGPGNNNGNGNGNGGGNRNR